MSVETHARGRRLAWTRAQGRCDDCRKKDVGVVILHVGGDGEDPQVPLVALCSSCLVRGLDPSVGSRW